MPLVTNEWKIIEEGWDPGKHQGSESLFSLGNGYMGQRANFEENYSGQHLQGSYIAGIYYPDKTRVGWWKNGYPEYFAKVLNSVNWIGIKVAIEGKSLDLHSVPVTDFYRELNMKEGYLLRSFTAEIQPGKKVKVKAQRFLSMKRKEIGAIRFSITPVNFSGKLALTPYLDFDVVNHDSNYDEKFWEGLSQETGDQKAMVSAKTKKLDFHVAAAMAYELCSGDELLTLQTVPSTRDKYAENHFEIEALEGSTYHLYKYAAVVSSLNHSKEELPQVAEQLAEDARGSGFNRL
ncbi:MAG: glycoside hydrolase family 65 protein, partial [Owenweeksia sp.]